jgi:1-acyl-sn-glycerol-3-phosphate acyltransferase
LLNQLVGGVGEAIWLPKSGDVAPALDRARDVLAQGGIIALAPEGTRNRDGLGRAETGVT